MIFHIFQTAVIIQNAVNATITLSSNLNLISILKQKIEFKFQFFLESFLIENLDFILQRYPKSKAMTVLQRLCERY